MSVDQESILVKVEETPDGERASALINSKIGEQLTGVYQLKGGVEKYMQTFPDGGHWKGLNSPRSCLCNVLMNRE